MNSERNPNNQTIMDKSLNYKDIPKNYLYCNHSKCPRRNKCLRYQAMLNIPQEVLYYTAINLNHVLGDEANCSFFSLYCTSLFASGINHLLDNIPHATAEIIRKEIYSLMGRNMYYRVRNKERLLHPDEQKSIAAIFLKHKINSKPIFDEYIEKYDW